jgi:hypothetical protein
MYTDIKTFSLSNYTLRLQAITLIKQSKSKTGQRARQRKLSSTTHKT